ncbi:C40 family peptidase [Iodobacter fluviatilis]|uniref:Peptidase P60 n=1 Tax=Iodobacter fluviatilis TaxID=537 RepID=A0A7G3GAR0_9NEIS|nr:C40 family peptidase [Iodobacter fluviatilis]QBC44467.1 peptidase P60 [Iodobacter fluviatilis]
MFSAEIMEEIAAHAAAEFPRECCGLVVALADGAAYLPYPNRAQGSEHFVLAAEDLAEAEDMGEILAVVHSHPNASPEPSPADRVSCNISGLPWLIVSHPPSGHQLLCPDDYQAPLLGRPFVHGVLDCYALIRDWYRQERSIVLPDFNRRDNWWLGDDNLYMDHFKEAGFAEVQDVDDWQIGDVILMQIRADKPNHGAVYLGDGIIMHHIHGRLSGRDVYGGFWQKVTVKRVRYA